PSGYRVPTFIRTCADECGKCSDEVDNQGNMLVKHNLLDSFGVSGLVLVGFVSGLTKGVL
ncbi:hypothetical protein, partial [Collinsella aerofaciens]|uniref:hypothetical protein n=1 Tax=Collinsella aerofaciens TaxID=74426 RepID=UPI001D121C54